MHLRSSLLSLNELKSSFLFNGKSLIYQGTTMLRTEVGDISEIKGMDIIVNVPNKYLSTSSGAINQKIHKVAGPELAKECKKLGGCSVGEAKITSAYNIPCEYIIHTVGPSWKDGHSEEVTLLKSCYQNSLRIALEHNARKIAFPAISTGFHSFPTKMAADNAVRSVGEYLLEHPDEFNEIVWVLKDYYTKSYFDGALAEWESICESKWKEKVLTSISSNDSKSSAKSEHGTDKTSSLSSPVITVKEVVKEKELHCTDDMRLLLKKDAKTVKIKGKKLTFPIYNCPDCGKHYTSVDSLKDLAKIKLNDIHYTNLQESQDVQRLNAYLGKAHPLDVTKKYHVYMLKPTKCKVCGAENLQRRKIEYLTSKNKEAVYGCNYCPYCDLYFVHLNFYTDQINKITALNSEEFDELLKKKEKKIEENKENSPVKKSIKKVAAHDNNISVKDFVVRKSTFKCLNSGHKTKDIDGHIMVINQKGGVDKYKIAAGYCPDCNIFFILQSTYDSLVKKGTPLCRMTSEKAYLKGGSSHGMKLAEESILMQYGYTVSQHEGLTAARRQAILAVLIDNNILTKNDVISYLDFFISYKKGDHSHKYEKAISKWQDDKEFVAEYKIGTFTKYNITGITVKH